MWRKREKKHKFALGHVVITPPAQALLDAEGENPADLLELHVAGDCGVLSPSDKAQNDRAVDAGLRIMSEYRVGRGSVYVITEADRSATTILLPTEY